MEKIAHQVFEESAKHTQFHPGTTDYNSMAHSAGKEMGRLREDTRIDSSLA